jgi:hypothetical protein
MPMAFITLMLMAPMPGAYERFVSPPPPSYAREGVGDDVRQNLNQLHQDVVSAEANGEIGPAAAHDLSVRVERLRRQLLRMGNVVGHRQRLRFLARIDAVRSQLAESRASRPPA